MDVLISVFIALLIGAVAYIVVDIVPFTKPYAGLIGLIVAILVFLSRSSF